MPSTEYFGVTMANFGPLTTTFTAASSCATATNRLVVADDFQLDPPVFWRSECEFPAVETECVPSASKFNELYASYRSGSLGGQGAAAYFSPASICPSGWETVGVAQSESDGVSTSGVFTSGLRPMETRAAGLEAMGLPPAGYFVGALLEGETLIWCCPSEHTVDNNGICYSSIEVWDPEKYDQFTTVCAYGVNDPELKTVTSFDGSTWSPPLLSYEGTIEPEDYTTFRETLDASPTGTQRTYTVWHSVEAIALVHGGSDGNGDNSDNNSDDNDDGNNNSDNNEEEEEEEGSGDNNEDAAPSIRALTLLPCAVVAVGMLAGMGVLMPW